MEAVCSSETLISTYKSTWRYNPDDQHGHDTEYFITNTWTLHTGPSHDNMSSTKSGVSSVFRISTSPIAQMLTSTTQKTAQTPKIMFWSWRTKPARPQALLLRIKNACILVGSVLWRSGFDTRGTSRFSNHAVDHILTTRVLSSEDTFNFHLQSCTTQRKTMNKSKTGKSLDSVKRGQLTVNNNEPGISACRHSDMQRV
jgi:hypothetical protein